MLYLLLHYVLDAAARHGMDSMARERLGYSPIPIEALIGQKERGKVQRNMRDIPPADVKDYAAEDADVTLQLEDSLRPAVKEAGLNLYAAPRLGSVYQPLNSYASRIIWLMVSSSL